LRRYFEAVLLKLRVSSLTCTIKRVLRGERVTRKETRSLCGSERVIALARWNRGSDLLYKLGFPSLKEEDTSFLKAQAQNKTLSIRVIKVIVPKS